MKKIKIGIIGTGRMAATVHLPALVSHEHAELVAICGRNQERTAELAEQYSIRERYADYRAMIAQSDLDAVAIVTPPDAHYPMAMAALEQGLHVMCEKPLAMDATQAAELWQKAEHARVKHMVFFTYRWLPHHRYFYRLIAEGKIGRPLYFCFRELQSRNLQMDRDCTWRDDRRRSLGVIGGFGSHLFDACRHCIGEIRTVSVSLATHMPVVDPGQANVPPNDSAVVTVETQNGTHGILYLSRVAAVSAMGQYLTVHGESGALNLESRPTTTGARIVLTRPGKPPKELPLPDVLASELQGDGPYFHRLLRFFAEQPAGDRALIDAIRGDPSTQPSFYDGYKAQQAIDAAFESHETGRRITMPDD
jgi:predicted dehydrogenase